MSPSLRLILIYFTGTRLSRGLSIISVTLISVGTLGLWKYAEKYSVYMTPGKKLEVSSTSIALSAVIWGAPMIGVLTLFFAGALMPAIFGHLARSRQLHMLPHGRMHLLSSAIGELCLVSVVFGLVTKALFLGFPTQEFAFSKAFVGALLTFSPMYLLVWLISRARGALGSLSGAMLIIPSLALPLYFTQIPQPPLGRPILWGALIGGASVITFLLAPRWRHWPLFVRRTAGPSQSSRPSYSPGTEFAVLTGTARPWVMSVGMVVPVAVATLFISSPSIWLCYFMLCSVIGGGISSLSVPRSRALWLRGPWTRSALLREIERLHWRQNAYCLSSSIVLLVAIGSYMDFPTTLLAVGIPLLLVGCASGTYLGLMMTRGVGWLDGGFAAVTMIILLIVALQALNLSLAALVGTDFVLAGMALGFRMLAQTRWTRLDWLECSSSGRRDARAL